APRGVHLERRGRTRRTELAGVLEAGQHRPRQEHLRQDQPEGGDDLPDRPVRHLQDLGRPPHLPPARRRRPRQGHRQLRPPARVPRPLRHRRLADPRQHHRQPVRHHHRPRRAEHREDHRYRPVTPPLRSRRRPVRPRARVAGPGRMGRPYLGKRVCMDIPRTLVMTGHFPPEPGGDQTFTWELVRRLPADRLVVVAPAWPGAAGFDAELGFPVVRRHGYLLFRGLRRLVAEHGVHTAWIPAAAPFAMYAPLVKAAGVRRLVASTHGQEIGWFRAAPTRTALRIVSRTIDALTYLTETCRAEVAAALGDRTPLVQLAGAVDPSRFRPGPDGAAALRRHGLGDGPVVVSVSRLVRRKGHDRLLDAWPEVLRRRPGA